ncbi:LysR family transcriptional regulator [Reyranella sp.]|uniref:LysR family transcriptional regulator n=1 Tax=Reyranella sp. TaxID=1929291 RepID=UPI003BAB460A
MELRHLRYFVAVAREGHITRAAERLNMQQPPLSQQIKALEAEIGAPLFLRHPRGVSLTDAGRSFLADAEAILASVEGATVRARRTARGETGRIAVGFTTSAPFHPLVARAIREFRATRPDVSFVLEETGSGELVAGLREERLDIAFIRSGLADPQGLSVHALLREDMAAALPVRHPLARRPRLTLRDLAAETFILYRRPDGRGLYDVIVTACAEAGFSPHVGQEAPRIVSTLNLVAAGLGITIVPASLSRLPLEGVVYRTLKGRPAVKVPLNLACRADERSAATLGFVDLVRRLA